MMKFLMLLKRDVKLFFKDKGMFFTSLITPLILLVLYATFLADVYRDSFASAMPAGLNIPDDLIDATVGGQLLSSLLAVSCVTVAFCSNLLMVQDKVNGTRNDLTVSPVKRSTVALAYFFGTEFATLIVNYVALGIGFIYLGKMGWYLSGKDVLSIILDVFLLTLFGTLLSSCVNVWLSTSGQASAVGTIISAGYGFICGAYMPISNFSEGLQKALSFLPGTYGTSLIRNHCLRGVYEEMGSQGFPADVVDLIKDSIDCNLYFFDNKVETETMYIIMVCAILVLLAVYILINVLRSDKRR